MYFLQFHVYFMDKKTSSERIMHVNQYKYIKFKQLIKLNYKLLILGSLLLTPLYLYFTDEHEKSPPPQDKMYSQLFNVRVSTFTTSNQLCKSGFIFKPGARWPHTRLVS